MNKIRVGEDNTGLWCNGNTQDFGPCVLGSNPGRPTIEINFKIFLTKFELFKLSSILIL